MTKLTSALCIFLLGCGLEPMSIPAPDAGLAATSDATPRAATPMDSGCSPCASGWSQVHFPPWSDVWCQTTDTQLAGQNPCIGGRVINWGPPGLVQCSSDPCAIP
jgi:hypothetical protein